MEQQLDEQYWNKRYAENNTGWDIGQISTPVKAYVDQLEDKNSSILIPGCGNAYEAEYLLQQGFKKITLVDISPVAVSGVKERLSAYVDKELTLICGDFFDLHQNFDLVIEQTFFCAIDPQLRKYYVDKVFNNLDAGGRLAGVLFDRPFEGGPPFGGSREEYEALFAPLFDIIVMEPCYNSIPPRQGAELFVILKKRSSALH
jgi:methyl halide transferase